jgi:lipid-binding SYLF domain-containing protein
VIAIKRLAAVTALAGGLLLPHAPARAQGAPDAQATVDHALGTLQDLRRDKEFGTARSLMHQARAVMIAPRIFKAGFFVGGEGGDAVLLARGPHGFSNPAFLTIASASFGLQIGAQESEMMLFIMSDRALRAVLKNKFQIGADAGIAVVTLGSEAGGATTSNVGPDIIVWASSSGAYAGISLNGTLIEPNADADRNYYGRALTSSEIVLHHAASSPAAAALVHATNSLC